MSSPNVFSHLIWKSQPRCPECSAVLDSATAADGSAQQPKPGDCTVCMYCATMLRFTRDLSVERLTDAEMRKFPPADREKLLKVQQVAWRLTLERKGALGKPGSST